jgi:response regulator NasT
MQKLRVLLADDEEPLRNVLRRVLEAKGMEVVGAVANGEEAVQLSLTVESDVLLIDLKMPVMDGIEAARKIAARQSSPIIIMHSAYADASLMEEARSAGVHEWVQKGVRPRELCAGIYEIAGRTGSGESPEES